MRTITILGVIVFVLVLVAAGTGVVYAPPAAPIQYLTPRGEHATLQGSGLYRYDPVSVAREGILWDALDLCLALPLLAVALFLTRRGSLRGRLLLSGVLFYTVYKYAMYATMVAFNPLFLVYVGIFGLGGVALFTTLAGIDVADLPSRISARFPRRLFIGFTFAMSAVLTLLWVGGRVIPYLQAGRFPDEFGGMTTLETQAFDLGLVVPLLATTGILLWRRSAWGYLLAGLSITFGFIMSIVLPAWILVPLLQDGKVNPVEASPLLVLCLVGLYVAAQFFLSVQDTPAAPPRRGALPAK